MQYFYNPLKYIPIIEKIKLSTISGLCFIFIDDQKIVQNDIYTILKFLSFIDLLFQI